MATINPYLNFKGNAEEAFDFYKSVFGGDFLTVQRFKDTPEGGKMSKTDQQKIMHIALPIGKGNMLMATDAIESMGHTLTAGNNFYIAIHTDTKEEADTLYNKLSIGGKIEVELHDAFWKAYFGMFMDKFGTRWMINFAYPQ